MAAAHRTPPGERDLNARPDVSQAEPIFPRLSLEAVEAAEDAVALGIGFIAQV